MGGKRFTDPAWIVKRPKTFFRLFSSSTLVICFSNSDRRLKEKKAVNVLQGQIGERGLDPRRKMSFRSDRKTCILQIFLGVCYSTFSFFFVSAVL